MDIFDILALIGGLCLFLFGMNLMGEYLEKSAGEGLKALLGRLTSGKTVGFLTGLLVTSVIQSSSAATVMVVGFVNSGLMSLKQAINVIMGANVGTTVTAWILSLTGIKGDSVFVRFFKPTSFTPVLALIGIILYLLSKNSRKKDIGVVLLGFSVLMFGMDGMADAVEGLKNVPSFTKILTVFSNPLLGVIGGALLTAIIQSSSASVGILQALSSTGAVKISAAIPIIMGQNIGTCVTALISSVGTNRNARRASVIHLSFNVIGTAVLLTVYTIINYAVRLDFVDRAADSVSIAVIHTVFNVLCTLIILPFTSLLEKIAYIIIKEPKNAQGKDEITELDERLFASPSLAIERSRLLAVKMAKLSVLAFEKSVAQIEGFDSEEAERIREYEIKADKYEDILGSYLVKLNSHPMSAKDSTESSKLLFCIGDLERISDHAVNILESAEEINEKKLRFSKESMYEMKTLCSAVAETLKLTYSALKKSDVNCAIRVEPLEQVVDLLKNKIRTRHILRLQKGEYSIEAGFVWSDLLTNLERVSDHCSNIAGSVLEMAHDSHEVHGYLSRVKHDDRKFTEMFNEYAKKYSLK